LLTNTRPLTSARSTTRSRPLRKRIERTHDVVSIDAEIKREGTVPAHTGPVTLFIDPFGRPLSPVSVCGVRRRWRRRMRRRF
jgi:hypothetical protein